MQKLVLFFLSLSSCTQSNVKHSMGNVMSYYYGNENKLPDELKGETCAICQDNLDDTTISLNPCKHSFHRHCLLQWAETAYFKPDPTCPMCRQKINKHKSQLFQHPPQWPLCWGKDNLFLATYNSDIEQLKELAASGIDLDRQDSKGYTPLHVAMIRGNLGCINILIDHGASTSIRDHTLSRPIHYAFYAWNLNTLITLSKAMARNNRL